MASIKKDAVNIAKYKTAIEQIKELTFKSNPVIVVATKFCEQYKVRQEFFRVLAKLSIISKHDSSKGRISEYQWVYGARPIDEKLTLKVIDACLSIMKKYESNSKNSPQTKLKEAKKEYKNPTVKKNVSEHVGVLFTLKQLDNMGEYPINSGTDLTFKTSIGDINFNNVDQLEFVVEDSNINILVTHKSKEETRAKIVSELKLNNVALAFSRRGASSTIKGILIEVVEGPNIHIN